MGACYSKKASGGNRSYTTVHMASTKLEEASRLARPTPYTRTQNANIDFAAKKNTPQSAKQGSMAAVEQSDLKNMKNNFQSNIPRFSSSLPVSTSLLGEHKTLTNCNENEALHVVNNNAIVNSRSAFNVSNTLTSPVNKMVKEPQTKPKIGSKSCPDKILPPEVPEKPARTPIKGSGIMRHFLGKSSPSSSHNSPETQSVHKMQPAKAGSRNSRGASPMSKSPSRKGFESRDSLSDFDSGLGNSLTDKNKPEDSDTVKDLEQLEFQEEFSPNINVDSCSNRSTSTPKHSLSDTRLSLKAPTYKREVNGKWSFDEKHFGPETTSRNAEPKALTNSGRSSPHEKHSFKMTASENIFSTYASYKGLLSYQKKSFKPSDVKFNIRDKSGGERSLPPTPPNLSSIPKMRRQLSQPISGNNSVFYVQSETENCAADEDEQTLKCDKPDQQYHSKQSSLDSDEKSDSTENGVLSPPSDDNREFLIDDEIADQPGLTFFSDPKSEESDVQSLQQAMTELHALQLASTAKKRTDSVSSYSSRKGRTADNRDSLVLGSELDSSCSSIASDDLMMDYEKTFDGFPEGTVNEGPASPMRKLSDADKVAPLKSEKRFDFEDKGRKRLHRRSSGSLSTPAERLEWRQRTVSLPLRPPRQMTVSEADDGGLKLDSSSYRLLCQDLNGVKTLLLRLKTVIQEAETINPFDQTNPNNLFYHSLAQSDFPSNLALSTPKGDDKKGPDFGAIFEENTDLRRQLVLVQQQLEDKEHTISLLQQQMTKYLNVQAGCNHGMPRSNAATQTERSHSLSGSLSSSSSADDSIETLVSVQEDFEKSFRKNSKEQDVLSGHLIEVVRLLDRTPSNSSANHSEC